MVWNKTPQEKVNAILISLEDVEKDYNQIAQELEVSAWIVGDICRKYSPSELKKKRYSAACRRGKLGNKNPMFGKVGLLHHNATEDKVRVAGYKTVFKPDWWEGKIVLSGRIYEHHYVWAKENGKTYLPKGTVIHHIDCDINNNDPTNLICLSISEHIKLHAKIRKEQRLSRKGVESSTLEAHSNLMVEDIV